MVSKYEQEFAVAAQAVRQAAALCRTVQASITPDVLAKKDRSPVTVADFGSQAVVCRALNQAFPDDPIIAEEDSNELTKPENAGILEQVVSHVRAQHRDADHRQICRWIDHGRTREYRSRFWTLDPIDGTKGFLRGEQYAVSLALIVDGQIQLGLLGCPNLPVDSAQQPGAMFHAIRGHGAWTTPLDGTRPATPIHVSSESDSARARFCESVESGHSAHGDAAAIATRLGIATAPIRMDSQAKYAVVARGDAEMYLRLPTRADYHEKIWDHAGGVLTVLEAGGAVTDITGKPLDFTRGAELNQNRGVIVSNRHWQARLLAAIAELKT